MLLDTLSEQMKLEGDLPDLPTTEVLIAQYKEQSCEFADFIKQYTDNIEHIALSVPVKVPFNGASITVTLQANIMLAEQRVYHFRTSSPKGKDKFLLLMALLCVKAAQQNPQQTEGVSSTIKDVTSAIGHYFNSQNKKIDTLTISDEITDAIAMLQHFVALYLAGLTRLQMTSLPLVDDYFTRRTRDAENLSKFWHKDAIGSPEHDPYWQYFLKGRISIGKH